MSDEALVRDIKAYRGITWDDEMTDRNVENAINAGIAYLDSKRGEPGDYSIPGSSRTLLFEYVRYYLDAALDVFEQNYRSLILAMQHERQVSADGESGTV